MWNRIRKLFAPPIFEGDPEKTHAAGLLNTFLITVFLATFGYALVLFVLNIDLGAIVLNIILGIALITLVLWIILRLGYITQVSFVLPLILWAGFTILVFSFGGLHDSAITGFFAVIILTSAIASWQTVLFINGLNILSVIAIYIAENMGIVQASVTIPSEIYDFLLVILGLGFSGFLLRTVIIQLRSANQIAQENAVALKDANAALEENRITLETQTTALEQRTQFLETTAKIAREASSELDLNVLIARVVRLISDQFDFYHTGLFLIDETGEWAELKAASSTGGQKMLERNHKLRVGSEGIVGHVTATGETKVVENVLEDVDFYQNPDLSETMSEATWALAARGQILGALDIQSQQANAFSDEDVETLQILADQVAMAINNAQLYAQAQQSLEAERRAYGVIGRQAWVDIIQSQFVPGYRYRSGEVQPLQTQKEDTEPKNLPAFEFPVRIRGQKIGNLKAHKKPDSGDWSTDEIQVIETLINQLDIAMESARLYQDTQRRAAQEQIISEVTTNIRETLDVDSVMRTAVREIRDALGLHDVTIMLDEVL